MNTPPSPVGNCCELLSVTGKGCDEHEQCRKEAKLLLEFPRGCKASPTAGVISSDPDVAIRLPTRTTDTDKKQHLSSRHLRKLTDRPSVVAQPLAAAFDGAAVNVLQPLLHLRRKQHHPSISMVNLGTRGDDMVVGHESSGSSCTAMADTVFHRGCGEN
ncbi:lipid-transfer protein [Striga asiatica]|uniref:Lipid-transfer protein n=1 Tax=Striga asiatica TaxID=4170 RepID=A0A5A7R7V0_STRAF|nr:lipid-transfer protein [Striga asiatica]